MTTDTTATYVRRPGLNAVEMDGELVMMGLEQGEYFGLRDVSATLWNLLEAPRTLGELAAGVAAEYEVEAEVCTPDIVMFLDELLARKLIDSRC